MTFAAGATTHLRVGGGEGPGSGFGGELINNLASGSLDFVGGVASVGELVCDVVAEAVPPADRAASARP